jgi:hypothetical protein
MPGPPISVLLEQELVETSSVLQDGVSKKECHLSQSLFALACSIIDDQGVLFYALNVQVKRDSPSAGE